MSYDLWYWPGFPGRGEFVRLALEAGAIPYRDRGNEDGAEALMRDMAQRGLAFAPPYLVVGDEAIAQVANILLFLGDEHGLAPADPAAQRLANQLQLTIADIVAEAHDVHHPVDNAAYYEDQRAEAARAARSFRDDRIPKYLTYFDRVLARKGDWLTGESWSYADLSLFHLIEGLRHAFPKRMAAVVRDCPKVLALHEAVAALPALRSYLSSGRRLPFGEGIFRRYPELDAA